MKAFTTWLLRLLGLAPAPDQPDPSDPCNATACVDAKKRLTTVRNRYVASRVEYAAGGIRRWLLCWMASSYLEAEKSFRRIQGHRDLSVLGTALGRARST